MAAARETVSRKARARRARRQDIRTVKLSDIKPEISPRFLEFGLAKRTASGFGLNLDDPEDRKAFRAAWAVSKVWRRLIDDFAEGRYPGMSLDKPVDDAFGTIKTMVDTRDPVSKHGYRFLSHRLAKQKYVVFSDHHWSTKANRQNFFASNRKLYIDALKRYRDAGYIVIENGDVEEMLVRRYPSAEYRRWLRLSFPELQERRRALRLQMLEQTLKARENQALYAALSSLSAGQQLVRTVGNHDPDLHLPEFYELLRTKIADLHKPADFIFLERGTRVETIIAHGHHFDVFTNPTNAPYLGELIAETLSWAYQGPDRNWRWAWRNGNVRKWIDGSIPFLNEMVTDDHLALNLRTMFCKNEKVTLEAALETLLEKNVAWEYFLSDTPLKAYTEEVLNGLAFFKFRHMDEVRIMKSWNQTFPDPKKRPKLLLGHSHEVRINPRLPGTKQPYRFLLNSGTAGRFENLVWGLELDNGKAQVVGWTHANRTSKTEPHRFVYREQGNGLLPTEQPVPL